MVTTIAFWGIIIHLVCDWLLQNEWQAKNKANLVHPAAYVHSGVHTLGLLLVFSPLVALLIGVSHLLIDTHTPLVWWRKTIKQTTAPDNPATLHVAMWGDQVTHILVIALAALTVYGHW